MRAPCLRSEGALGSQGRRGGDEVPGSLRGTPSQRRWCSGSSASRRRHAGGPSASRRRHAGVTSRSRRRHVGAAWRGQEADKAIMAQLKAGGRLIKSGAIKHSYPFCWRSDTPLIYRAVPSWFVKVNPHTHTPKIPPPSLSPGHVSPPPPLPCMRLGRHVARTRTYGGAAGAASRSGLLGGAASKSSLVGGAASRSGLVGGPDCCSCRCAFSVLQERPVRRAVAV